MRMNLDNLCQNQHFWYDPLLKEHTWIARITPNCSAVTQDFDCTLTEQHLYKTGAGFGDHLDGFKQSDIMNNSIDAASKSTIQELPLE